MGGADNETNIIELSIEEHANAHKILYEIYGNWQDLIAWKGLSGLVTSDECSFIAMKEGGIKGSAITNGGFNYTDGKTKKKFYPWDVPVGWERVYNAAVRQKGIGSGTSSRIWYHNPNNPEEKIAVTENEVVPNGWVPGMGKKKRVACYWYNNGSEEGQFRLEQQPTGWERGRLKTQQRANGRFSS